MAIIRIPERQIGTYIISYIVMLALLLGVVFGIVRLKEKNEKEYSAESKVNDYVYADIVSIIPDSAVTKLTSSNILSSSKPEYEGFFCSCETIDGKTIKVYIDSNTFGKYIKKTPSGNTWWRNSMPDKVEFATPLRIHGKIDYYKDIMRQSYSNSKSIVFRINKSDIKME